MTSSSPALIDFRHVSVMRGSRVVLHDVSLKIDSGEHVAIMGPNGCGKSTLIKTITRDLYPLANENTSMRILGQERWEISGLRSLLGVVSNDMTPFGSRKRISGHEAVVSSFFSSMGLWPHQQPTPEMQEKTEEVLELLEVQHLAARPVNELSAGEVRRILIARALVHGPQALLLDEPSNSLDVFAHGELLRIMRKLAKSGIALLLVTHHLPDVIPEIERVIFMREGRIAGDGLKNKLLTARSLSSLFGCKVDLRRRDGYYHLR
jgi:iron complex transport system ATP-binding protein